MIFFWMNDDMQSYLYQKKMRGKAKMKIDVVPHNTCQHNRKRQPSAISRSAAEKEENNVS